MKLNQLLALAAFTSLLVVAPGFAQKKSKEDKALEKEWKNKLKSLDPLSYKKIVDDMAALRQENGDLSSKITSLESEVQAKNSELEKLKAENSKLDEEVKSNISKSGAKPNEKGVIFKVQIGAFRNKDLTRYLENSKNFTGEVESDGTKKYTLGYFGDYWEADNFKKYLREMGVSDAWIVAYKNGQRVDIKEVLEQQ
jgi:vacuolar-type H+-ATPase subunit I/STV1